MTKRLYLRCDTCVDSADNGAVVAFPTTHGDSPVSLRVTSNSVLLRDGASYIPVHHVDSDSLGNGAREVLVQFATSKDPVMFAEWVHEDRLIEVES